MIQFVLFDAVGTIIFPTEPIEATYSKSFAQFGIQAIASEIKAQFRAAFYEAFENESMEESRSLWATEALEQIDALEPAHRLALLRSFPTSESDQRERWQRVVQFCVDSFATDVSADVSKQIFAMLWEHFASPRAWRCESSFVALTQLLTERNIRWAIGSNFDSRLQQVVRGHRELDDCFAVFDSAAVGFAKPDPRFYAAIEKVVQLPKDAILMVGDDELNDYLAPRLHGWRARLHHFETTLMQTVQESLD